jgi:chromosome segregation ATPase
MRCLKEIEKTSETEIMEIKSLLNQIKNTEESHFYRTEQVEDRISELEDKIVSKRKTEGFLEKRLKNCKRNTQELNNSIKGPNLGIMGIKEGEEAQEKGICNIVNKKVADNFPNLEIEMPIQE